jgi:hypothetical protein
MYFNLTFAKSGDSILLEATENHDVLEHYVENLNGIGENIFTTHALMGDKTLYGGNLTDLLVNLDKVIKEANEQYIVELLGTPIKTYELEEYLNQRVLSKLHADYVNLLNSPWEVKGRVKELLPDGFETITFGHALQVINKHEHFDPINAIIHAIERSYHRIPFEVKSRNFININNPFSLGRATNNIANFSLLWRQLGRAWIDKFRTFDFEYEFQDANNFNELAGSIELKLTPPETMTFSNEYIAWCKKRNIEPCSRNINIGNIVDLEKNLTNYRQVIYRNLLASNELTIQLGKG